ncbi:MAG: hypothetical protein KIT45_05120 [Fimbriimonadia bacterium]|nr:hypothetical protein [Fimbriimonadia bacterium]
MKARWYEGALWVAFFLLVVWVTPLIHVPLSWVSVGTALTTLLFMPVVIMLAVSLTRWGEAWWSGPVMLAAGLFCWQLMLRLPEAMGWFPPPPPHQKPDWLVPFIFYRGVFSLTLLIAAVGLGRTIALAIREKNLLAPVVPFSAIVDMLTVFSPGGFVKQMLQNAPEVVAKASVAVPAAGAVVRQDIAPTAIIGVGDFIFLAMYAACLHKFQMRTKPTILGFIGVLTLYLWMVLFIPGFTKLPALVPMAAVFLIVNWREFQLNRSEKIASIAVVLLATGIIAYLFWR